MNALTAREALLAELLQDVDALLTRLEKVEGELAARVEQAVRDATAQAFLATKMNLESLMQTQERRLLDAAALASNQLATEFRSSAIRVLATSRKLERNARWIIAGLATFGLLMGVTGGVGGWLVAHALSR